MAKEYAQKFYKSKAWRDCRESYIYSVNGLCERCKAKGILKPGKILHHIKYITPENINDPEITLSHSNLEYLCQDCHNNEHQSTPVIRKNLFFDENGNIKEIKK